MQTLKQSQLFSQIDLWLQVVQSSQMQFFLNQSNDTCIKANNFNLLLIMFGIGNDVDNGKEKEILSRSNTGEDFTSDNGIETYMKESELVSDIIIGVNAMFALLLSVVVFNILSGTLIHCIFSFNCLIHIKTKNKLSKTRTVSLSRATSDAI